MRIFTNFLSILLSVFLFTSFKTELTLIYTLTTSMNGKETITPLNGEFEEGETVTLTSSPNIGWIFKIWSGDASGNLYSIGFIRNL